MTPSPEYTEVEFPLLEQLSLMGWSHLAGDKYVPALTERELFKQTLLESRLRAAIRRINTPHCPWLDDSHITQAVNQFTRLPAGLHGLLAINAHLTRLLLGGVQITGPENRGVTLQVVDYRDPDRNDFLAINQFWVDPPGYTGGAGFIVPDVVLFVNGLPLVVIGVTLVPS
ncbi:type I restriction endonuclease [Deinococcus sp.]|uniref:type I restriction endonuclease n=1 Tax=Deinococcus sp. TaxID=47478 RepID=UPI003B5A8EE0